jgi:N,N'-diacetylchitobiose transport system substrate-binding protein
VNRRYSVAACAVTLAAGLAACGSSSSSSGSAGSSTSSGPRTLTVWLMKGSAPDPVVSALNSEFHASHPNVTVNVQIQQWSGIADKVTAALSTSTPPDVLEMGNTQVSAYADAGGLMDLTSKKDDLGGSTWLKSLAEAGTTNNKLYGVPYYAGDRVVIYNKQMFTQAGITTPPTTRDEFVADGQKLMQTFAHTAGFSGLYLPGKDWYAIMSWVFDNGGNIATQNGNQWQGTLESQQAQSALTWVKDMRSKVGTAPGDGDETKDDATFEAGQAAMVIEPGWHVGQIGTDKPALKDQLGVFPIPGQSGSAPVFLGGSNLGIAAKSPNQDLAYDYVKLLSGTKYQTLLAQQGGVIPNTTTLLNIHASDPILSVADVAATKSWFVPSTPNWTSIESSNVLQDMLAKVFTGQADVSSATQAADQAITSKLNA